MLKTGIVRDLSLLTAVKLLVLGVIYIALFAPFVNHSNDIATHLLGFSAIGGPSHQSAPGGP